MFEFQQTYNGYTVYGSSIRLNAAKRDGTVYNVSTSLSEIKPGDFKLEIQKDAIWPLLRKLYSGRSQCYVAKEPG